MIGHARPSAGECASERALREGFTDDDRLTYIVQYRRDGQTYLDEVPAELVRLDTVDRSNGRGEGSSAEEA
jgi:hypothetical protein